MLASESGLSAHLNWIDYTVIILYFVLIVGLGCWAGLRRKRGTESGNYFLAGRSLTWFIIGLALFSTNISTIHLVGMAQEGYVNGLVYGNFEWMATFLLIVLALFFAPMYLRSSVTTLPDFLEKRYSRPSRDFLAVLSIVSAIFIHIGFSLYAGAVVLEGMFGIPIWVSIVAISLLTGLYTIIGGLLAVVLTESIQTIILLAGAICITAIGYYKVGGWSGIAENVEPIKLSMLRTAEEYPSLPWYAVLLGYPVIGLWYWCADQTIVQRVLGAKDENHARVGPLFAGFIKILPVFLFVLPGLIGAALVHQGAMKGTLEDPKHTYAFLISELLPVGLRGLIAAALMAALMSTVSGALNSVATLVSYDIVARWRPQTSEHRLVLVGRIATFCGMVAAMVWSTQVGTFETIFQGVVATICYISPPITAVFLWGLFSRRASSKGAFATLLIGSLAGFATFLIDFLPKNTFYIENAKGHVDGFIRYAFVDLLGQPAWHEAFLHGKLPSAMMMTFYLFVFCSVVLFATSWIWPHRHTKESEALLWKNPLDAIKAKGWRGPGDYRFLAALLAVTMAALYSFFR